MYTVIQIKRLVWKRFLKAVVLKDFFSNRVISRNGVLRWSPRSPTLKHAQLSIVYKEQPRIVGEPCNQGKNLAGNPLCILHVVGITSGNACDNALIQKDVILISHRFLEWSPRFLLSSWERLKVNWQETVDFFRLIVWWVGLENTAAENQKRFGKK